MIAASRCAFERFPDLGSAKLAAWRCTRLRRVRARPQACAPRCLDRSLCGVSLRSGCRGVAPAGMAHGCAAFAVAAGAALVVGQTVRATVPADQLFRAPHGNNCRSGEKVGAFTGRMDLTEGRFP